MERVNSILKIIIGIVLIVSFVASFSSCETKKEDGYKNEKVTTGEAPKDSSMASSHEVSNDWESIKGKVYEEDKEMDAKFDELKSKASKAGGKVKTEVNKSVEDLKVEKKKLKSDSLTSDFKEKWDSFKVKSKDAVDNMEKKLKK